MHTQVHQAADKCCDVVRSRARRPGREVQRVNIDPFLDTESAKSYTFRLQHPLTSSTRAEVSCSGRWRLRGAGEPNRQRDTRKAPASQLTVGRPVHSGRTARVIEDHFGQLDPQMADLFAALRRSAAPAPTSPWLGRRFRAADHRGHAGDARPVALRRVVAAAPLPKCHQQSEWDLNQTPKGPAIWAVTETTHAEHSDRTNRQHPALPVAGSGHHSGTRIRRGGAVRCGRSRHDRAMRGGTCDDCGFAPFCDDTIATREAAFAKIRARV